MGKLYVYCARKSNGALELVRALGATRLRNFDGADFWDKNRRVRLLPGSSIISWGGRLPDLDEVRTLNSQEKPLTKENEIVCMQAEGLATVKLIDPARADRQYSQKDYIKAGYLGRTNYHQGGTDLLFGTKRPDFYTMKDVFETEVRIHSFNGRSIRAGIKVPREGFIPVEEKAWRKDSNMVHPWIRSFDGGWRIKYDGFKSTAEQRAVAAKAVKAIGLIFGAVDIGIRADKKLIVLEVNSAPGLEGGTIDAYVKAIERWYKGAPAELAVEVDE